MTVEDLTNLVIIYFSHRQIKLFRNEPHKKLINRKWQTIKSLGLPKGSPDLIGWNILNGQFYGIEIKTKNDKLSNDQKKMLKLMNQDNCMIFIANEINDFCFKLTSLKTKKSIIINEPTIIH